MYKYLRFAYLPMLFTPLTIVGVLAGEYWPLAVMGIISTFHLVYDNAFKPDDEVLDIKFPSILNFYLYMQLPTSLVCLFALLWQISSGDLFGFGEFVATTTGFDIYHNHINMTFEQKLIAAISVGYNLSANTVVGHELVHRTKSQISVLVGRLLLALVGDAQFSISHVALRSSIGQYKEAWAFEKKRLLRTGSPSVSLSNRVVTGLLMTIVVATVFCIFAGWTGAILYFTVCLIVKFLFEIVNYIEHYGLVRVAKTKISPRHSWNCNKRAASYVLYNLTRHSDHHANASRPYWELESSKDSMRLEYGYVAHIMLAMIPFLWFKFMSPRLQYWDDNFATPEEKMLVEKYL